HVEEALSVPEARASLNSPVGDEDGSEFGDLFADEAAGSPEELAEDALRARAVREGLAQLPDRERRILELRFGLDTDPHSLGVLQVGVASERLRKDPNEKQNPSRADRDRRQLYQLRHDVRDTLDTALNPGRGLLAVPSRLHGRGANRQPRQPHRALRTPARPG